MFASLIVESFVQRDQRGEKNGKWRDSRGKEDGEHLKKGGKRKFLAQISMPALFIFLEHVMGVVAGTLGAHFALPHRK